MKEIDRDKRFDYWNYLTSESVERPRIATQSRLMKIKPEMIGGDDFWFQVIGRHGAEHLTATEFYKSESAAAQHSRSNFWALIREKLQEEKL